MTFSKGAFFNAHIRDHWRRNSKSWHSGHRLRGPARREWEHGIPAVKVLRYGVTFRTFGEEDSA